MNKQRVSNQIASANHVFAKFSIPYSFSLTNYKGHPVLMLNTPTGASQIRKGNYAQVYDKLCREFNAIHESFIGETLLRITTKDGKVFEMMYNEDIPVTLFAQLIANLLYTKIIVTLNNVYTFIVNPK